MAYEVTATRRRPKTFDELAGQEFVAATLKSSIETGRIAHAYLFSGPRGCGKTSAARILARSLNCEKGPTPVPCGVCSSCREISRGASLDIIEIDGASNNSVDNVRRIKDEVLFPPNGGRYKVYIIDEVHMLSNSAFNALLKTIEEPPPYIIFIFATTELHKVPATIKSRCQQFNFRLIPIETIRDILKKTCEEMNTEAEDDALFWIAKESTGSLRDAYTLFDQVVSFSDGRIRSQLIRDTLGLVGLDTLNTLAETCTANNTTEAFVLVDGILESGVAIEQFVIDFAGYYRSLLLLQNGVTRESLLGYSPERFSRTVREKLDSAHLEQALSLFLDLYRNIRYSVSPRFELETVISKLCWLDRWVSPLELREAVSGAVAALGRGGGIARPLAGLEPRGAPETFQDNFDRPGALAEEFKRQIAVREETIVRDAVVPEAAVPEQPPEEAHCGPDELRDKTIRSLKQVRGILASGLEKSLPWKWEKESLVIPIRDALAAQLLKNDASLIRQVLADLWGSPLGFEITVEAGDASFKEKNDLTPEAALVLRMFRGTVVKQNSMEKSNEY
jgi:DNA polymerase-3 subunit gamma/tau